MSGGVSGSSAGVAVLAGPAQGGMAVATGQQPDINASGGHLILHELSGEYSYANPQSATKPIRPQPMRLSSRAPVRRYEPENWPYAPDLECQKDWDEASE